MAEASKPTPASSGGRQQRTAFVFAGGGSLGAVQVGMLRSLTAHGLKPDMVVGSSVGATNSAYYAGASTVEGVERLEKIWRALRRRDVFPITPRVLLGLMRRRDFLLGSEGLYRLVHAHLPYRNLEETKIPVHIVATDLLSGEPVVLSQGSAAQAIVASTAIPAAFAPVKVAALSRRRRHHQRHPGQDRGAARGHAADRGYACARETPPQGAVANALHALALLISRQIRSELEGLDGDECPQAQLMPWAL
jgi:NTE family protein